MNWPLSLQPGWPESWRLSHLYDELELGDRSKHPDQARSYSCEQMWKIWLHDVLYRLPADTWRCRGRGLGRRLVYEALAFLSPLLLKLPDRASSH